MSFNDLERMLGGRLRLEPGDKRDYAELERFHYCAGRPATFAQVWRVRFCERAKRQSGRIVAVAVVSYPTLASAAREKVLKIAGWPAPRKWRFVIRHVRTISRVIVHPQFRGLGLAHRLVRAICNHCDTRYLEAFAKMGRVNPFFEKGGMRRMEASNDGPVYYLFECGPKRGRSTGRPHSGQRSLLARRS